MTHREIEELPLRRMPTQNTCVAY